MDHQDHPVSATRASAFDAALLQECMAGIQAGDLDRAEGLCRRMLGTNRQSVALLRLLSLILARQERFEEATAVLSEALIQAPQEAVLHRDQALLLTRLGRHDEALALCDRAIALSPGDHALWNARGEVLGKLDRTVEALTSFDRAVAIRPDFADALANRGNLFRELQRPQEALANYVRYLALRPDDARIVSRCGTVQAALGRQREALDHHDRARRMAPDDAEVHAERGTTLALLGRHTMALAAFARAIALRPDDAATLVGNARSLCALGQHEEAVVSYDRALALDPTLVTALQGRSVALRKANRAEGALEAYDRALAADPDSPEALIGKGNALTELKRYEEALECYDRALRSSRTAGEAQTRRADVLDKLNRLSLAEAHYFRGKTLYAIEQYTEALEAYDQALALCPDFAAAWNGRGLVLAELGEWTDALASYDRAAMLRPEDAAAYSNRSSALHNLGRLEEAIAAADLALAIEPGNVAALNNRGNALRATGRVDAALACFDLAVAADAQNSQSHFNRAVCRLVAGNFARGWDEYEWRSQLPGFEKGAPPLLLPRWRGEHDLAGRTILLHAEQGHGDTIQFCRYVPLVAAKGAAVVLAVQPLLMPLLAQLPGVSQLAGPSDRASAVDLRCSLLSLPLAFGTLLETIPANVPYLDAPAANRLLWHEKLGERRGRRIGLAWSGNRKHKNDRDRSLSLAELAPIAAAGLPLYCLQREMRPEDLADFAIFSNIRYFGNELRDFADTAGLIAHLDLVITVDTAVAHLAGAMGKPVWVLLPHSADFRWLLDREDSPWYPTMRLFRQPRRGDWAPVVERVAREVGEMLSGRMD